MTVGALMGSDTGPKRVSSEITCFSSTDPLGDHLITEGLILLKPRPIRRTLVSRKRICGTRERAPPARLPRVPMGDKLHIKSHGKDGRYLVLVVGPFANLF